MRYFFDECYIEARNEAANEAANEAVNEVRNIKRLQISKHRKSLYTLTV